MRTRYSTGAMDKSVPSAHRPGFRQASNEGQPALPAWSPLPADFE